MIICMFISFVCLSLLIVYREIEGERERNTKRKRKNGNNRRLKVDIKSYRIIIVYHIYLDLIELLTLLWLVQLYIISFVLISVFKCIYLEKLRQRFGYLRKWEIPTWLKRRWNGITETVVKNFTLFARLKIKDIRYLKRI